MKNHKTITAVIATVALLASAALYAAEAETPDYVPGELIVKLEHGIIDPGTFEETPKGLTTAKTLLYYFTSVK